MVLTDEQRAQIEEKRKKALELRAVREAERRHQRGTEETLESQGGFTREAEQLDGTEAIPAEEELQSTPGSSRRVAREVVEQDHSTCEACGAEDQRIDKAFRDVFRVSVCLHCKAENDDYALMSKGDAVAEFLLQEGTIRVLPYIERSNPRHSKFQSMKLYLKKQVREKSYARWGGEEGLELEHEKRRKRKFEAALKRTDLVFIKKDKKPL